MGKLKLRLALTAGVALAVLAGTVTAGGAAAGVDLGATAGEGTSVVEIRVAGRDELDRLVGTGVDLDHGAQATENGIEVRAVVTPSEAATLQSLGFAVGETLSTPADTAAVLAEREQTLEANAAENEAFAAAAYDETNPDVSDVKIVRADYYTSFGTGVLSVEAKWANGQTSSQQLVVERDSGPGTAMGSGGTQNISRFVDAGVYLYHRGASSLATRPDYVRITSPTGDVAVAKVNDWLPIEGDDPFKGDGYEQDFIASYLTPTELYDRIRQLAADFPALAEVVELPYKTNGYRRKAQALLDPPPNRVIVNSPSPAAGSYTYAQATYGPAVQAAGVSGAFALVNDGSATPTLGCGPLVGFPAGAIALVDRGSCNYTVKTLNAQAAGAVAVVVLNNVAGAPPAPGGTAPSSDDPHGPDLAERRRRAQGGSARDGAAPPERRQRRPGRDRLGRVGPRGRQRRHDRGRPAGGRELAACRLRLGQRRDRPARHGRSRCRHFDGRPGRRGAERGGGLARVRLHLPGQRRHGPRADVAAAGAERLPRRPGHRLPRPAPGVRAPDREGARRVEDGRPRVRAGARPRVGAAARDDRDGGAAAAQLRPRTGRRSSC